MIGVGSILWEMHGKKRNKEIHWYPVPKCVEEVTKHMYMYGDGCGCSHNSVGKNCFESREECIAHFLESHDSLVTQSDYDEPLPDNCYEMPRTEWGDYEVCKFDGVNVTSVYLNGFGRLLDVTNHCPWRKENGEYRGDIEVLTLDEIYKHFAIDGRKPMITVFVNDPMKCNIYQCGNYKSGEWVYLGNVMGYA